jgi:hypothetical protein
MRISDDRYTRDIRRMNLAHRLIQHEVRTQWICRWTGLSPERVRNLYRSYRQTQSPVSRHRGPVPRQIQSLMRSTALRNEASALAGLAVAMRLVPAKRMEHTGKTVPGIALGERVCLAFDIFRRIVPGGTFSMDQFILLVLCLCQDDSLGVEHCSHCDGALLVDRLAPSRHVCGWCRQATRDERSDTLWTARPPGEATGVRVRRFG